MLVYFRDKVPEEKTITCEISTVFFVLFCGKNRTSSGFDPEPGQSKPDVRYTERLGTVSP